MMPAWFRLRRVRILGAPIYVHWSVFLVLALLAFMSFRSLPYAVVAIASYLSIIVIHESGHVWMARRLGCGVAAIRVAFLHGSCTCTDIHGERDHVLIAWAGILAQLAVALPVLVLGALLEDYELGYAAPAVVFLGYVNVAIALINLAPARGLDGQQAWRALPLLWKWWSARWVGRRVVRRPTRRK